MTGRTTSVAAVAEKLLPQGFRLDYCCAQEMTKISLRTLPGNLCATKFRRVARVWWDSCLAADMRIIGGMRFKSSRCNGVDGQPHDVFALPIALRVVCAPRVCICRCCCCRVSGNSVSLLTSACLFGLITSVQYFFALIANSKALQVQRPPLPSARRISELRVCL